MTESVRPAMACASGTLLDISPPIHAASPVFPGDTAYSQQWSAKLGGDCPVNVAAITLSPHVGAHADAPLHYDPHGAAIGAVSLTPFIGPCRVVHAMGCGPLIRPAHLAHAIHANAPPPPRVLVRLYHRMPQDRFDPALPAFAAETVAWLAGLGVLLLGTDSASVDPASSKDLPAHQALRVHGLRVLENLVLDDVEEGDYELIALPLKLMAADASPVRAVLRVP